MPIRLEFSESRIVAERDPSAPESHSPGRRRRSTSAAIATAGLVIPSIVPRLAYCLSLLLILPGDPQLHNFFACARNWFSYSNFQQNFWEAEQERRKFRNAEYHQARICP